MIVIAEPDGSPPARLGGVHAVRVVYSYHGSAKVGDVLFVGPGDSVCEADPPQAIGAVLYFLLPKDGSEKKKKAAPNLHSRAAAAEYRIAGGGEGALQLTRSGDDVFASYFRWGLSVPPSVPSQPASLLSADDVTQNYGRAAAPFRSIERNLLGAKRTDTSPIPEEVLAKLRSRLSPIRLFDEGKAPEITLPELAEPIPRSATKSINGKGTAIDRALRRRPDGWRAASVEAGWLETADGKGNKGAEAVTGADLQPF